MDEIKGIIDDLGNEALEASIGLAAVGVISDAGEIIYQTENIDLRNISRIFADLLEGNQSFTFNNTPFTVVETNQDGIIASNEGGMGHMVFTPFKGGILVGYAMPNADISKFLPFLQKYISQLTDKL